MREEKIIVDGIEVYLDAGVREWKPAAYPYCRIRGRRITEEQAIEVIRHCDVIFKDRETGLCPYPDGHQPVNLDMNWFSSHRFGWVHPNGIVGANMTLRWYAKLKEDINRMTVPRKELPELPLLCAEQLAGECAVYAKDFPFLELVIAVTDWNEEFPERKKQREQLGKAMEKGEISDEDFDMKSEELILTDLERDGFEAAVSAGVWLHDGQVEIMTADRTREKYLEYEKNFEEADKRVYLPEYYSLIDDNAVTRDFLCSCIAAYGISDPDGYIRQKIRRVVIYDLRYLPRGVRNGAFLHETITEVDGVRVIIDSEAKDWDSFARRPYYRIRGKSVSEEQALEVIRCCDSFFSWDLRLQDHSDCISPVNFNMWWFASNHFPEKYGWIHPNGIVGVNAIMQKYPNTEELIEEWTEIARKFPFLDLVAAIFRWDEQCPERRQAEEDNFSAYYREHKITEEEFDRRSEELEFTDFERDDSCRIRPRENFRNSIEAGVWLHGGIVEIMEKDRAYEKYIEYEKLYENPDPRIYMPEYYSRFQPDIVTKEYLYKCIRAYGIDDPEKLLSEETQPYETANLK